MSRSAIPTTGSLFLCALLLAACDSRELVAPGLQPAGRPRAVLSEPVSLGSNVLPPPPNTSGAPGATVRLGTVPANTWVVFEVSGSVSGSWNPDCNSRPPFWPCAAGPIAQSFMSGADPWAPVTIAYTYEEGGTHVGRALLRGTGESSAIGLYHLSLPSTLDGYVKTNTLTSWDPNFGVTLPSYINLSGGYTVTATLIPSPFRVTETADESGVITYTAEPLYGLEFSNPYNYGHLPPGDLVWTFFPGDSADQPDHSWPGWYMYHCERKLVCQFRPPGPGRMQISAYVERQRAYVRSKPAAEPQQPQEPKLNVSCSPAPVTRGDPTVCTATAQPTGASMSDLVWTFVDSIGHQIPGPTGTTDRWDGTMVVSGVVKVSGKVNGVTAADSFKVTVEARTWAGLMVYPAELPKAAVDTAGVKRFPRVPVTTDTAGYDQWIAGALGLYEWGFTAGSFRPGSGPNKGWYYRPAPPRFQTPAVWVSTHLQPGDPFYEAQTGSRPLPGEPRVPSGYTGYCTRRDMDVYRQSVLEHEGAAQGTNVSHHSFNVDYFKKRDPAPEFERDAFYMPPGAPDSTLLVNTRQFREQFAAQVNAANTAVTHAPSNVYTLRCKVRYP